MQWCRPDSLFAPFPQFARAMIAGRAKSVWAADRERLEQRPVKAINWEDRSKPKVPDLHLVIQCSRSTRHDQRQVQTLPQCLKKARVLSDSELSQAYRPLTRTEHCDSIEQTLTRLAGESNERLRVAILPSGLSQCRRFPEG